MALSNMEVFNEYYMPAIYESLAQMIDGFNQSSNGAIQLATAKNTGDFLLTSFYDSLQASQRRVDRYAAIGTVSNTDLTQSDMNMVKIAGGFGPIAFEPSQMSWLQKPTAEAIEIISRQFAEAVMKDQLNTSIAALVAAIENVGATTTVDVSSSDPITQSVLNSSHALFGDMSQSLVCQVMCGAQYHKLIGQNLVNAATLFQSGNVRVVDILGKRVVVTDAPALTVSTTDYKVLSLVEGAAMLRDPKDPIVNLDTRNGGGRILTTLQADYDFTLGLKGYSWDTANGGKSPTDAEVATGSNWDKTVSSVKNTAGVLAIGDQS